MSVSLDRADWELEERGCLTDLKTKEAVKNPNGYLFTALVKFGAFRAHPEYVNRAEELARDVEAEIKRGEDARFRAWLAGLATGEKAGILEKKPGGPDEPWLRLHWARHVRDR